MYQNIKNLSDLENEIINKTNIKILNNKVIKAIGKKDWQEEWMQSSKPMRFGEKLWIYPDHLIDNLEGKGRALGVGDVKFRGQVRPYHKKIVYNVSVKKLITRSKSMIWADAEMQADDKKIYTAKNLQVGIFDNLVYDFGKDPSLDSF